MREAGVRTLTPSRGPIVFFDGHCVLCNGFADFILARDRRGRYRLAPLQGETAAARLPDSARSLDTVILLEDGVVRRKSDAALRIVGGLGGFWKLAALLRVIPPLLRDGVYDFIAHRRVRWFGRRAMCRAPGPGDSNLLLP